MVARPPSETRSDEPFFAVLTKTSRAMRLASSAQLVQRMARADEQRDQRSVALFRNLSCEG